MVLKRKTSKFLKRTHKKTRKFLGGLTENQIQEIKNRNNICKFEYKILPWVEENKDKLDFKGVSLNPNAIEYLEKNLDKVDWIYLSKNRNAIPILEKNLDEMK
jgi:hypothetical protein